MRRLYDVWNRPNTHHKQKGNEAIEHIRLKRGVWLIIGPWLNWSKSTLLILVYIPLPYAKYIFATPQPTVSNTT